MYCDFQRLVRMFLGWESVFCNVICDIAGHTFARRPRVDSCSEIYLLGTLPMSGNVHFSTNMYSEGRIRICSVTADLGLNSTEVSRVCERAIRFYN
jgi:hypothetical protein